jgi:tRNA-modifying protein YgfZ
MHTEVVSGWQDLAAGESSVHVGVDRLDAIGPDTVKFLHSLVSQNIVDLTVGSGSWTFLLQPQGKVTSFAYAARLGDEHVVLLTEPGFGEQLHTALSRYRIRTKCELTLSLDSAASVSFADGVPKFSVSETPESFLGGEGPAIYNTARIVNGWPAQPQEVNEATIPNETGVLRQSVNFTKGCYVGQELVERIDSRAATTPRRLVRLIDFAVSDPQVAVGADLDLTEAAGAELFAVRDPSLVLAGEHEQTLGDSESGAEPATPRVKTVGVLTSIVRSLPGPSGFSAIGYVMRAVGNGAQVAIAGTSFVATVAVLRNDAPAATVVPAGVRSSATMGKKA